MLLVVGSDACLIPNVWAQVRRHFFHGFSRDVRYAPKRLKDLAAFVRQSSEGRGDGGGQYPPQQQQQQQQQRPHKRQQKLEQQPQHRPSDVTAPPLHQTQERPLDISASSPETMASAAAPDNGRTFSTQKPLLLSETASLAELVVQEMTASALHRTSSNMSNQRASAFTEAKSDAPAEPRSAGTTADHGSTLAIPESCLRNGSLATLAERPVAKSAPHHSGGSDGLPPTRTKPAAAPSDLAKQMTAQTSGGLSETESMAEMVVRFVTATALERSGSSNSSLLRAGPKTTPGSYSVRDLVVKEEGAGGAGQPLAAEETVPTPKQGVPSQNESFAELVVRSVTASALQRSTSSLLKLGAGNGPRLVNDGSTKKSDRKNEREITGDAAGHATHNYADDDAAQTTVARNIETNVETTKSSTATTSTNTLSAGETKPLKEAGRTTQSNILIRQTRESGGELSGDASRHINAGIDADGGKGSQAVKTGDETDRTIGSSVERSSAKNDPGKKDTIGNQNAKKLYGREEDAREEDHTHEYSSDTFEKEEDAQTRSGSNSSSLTSSSSYSRGNQRRRPPQPGREIVSVVVSAAVSSFDGQTIAEAASADPYTPTPPTTHCLEESINNHVRNNDAGDARIVGETGGLKSPGAALPSSTDRPGKSTSTGGTGAGQNAPVSVDNSSASRRGHATSPRPTTPSTDVTDQGSTGGGSIAITPLMPTGAVVGLEALHRDLSAWFAGEVLAPSTSAAMSVLETKGGLQSPNAFSSISQLTGGAVEAACASSLNGGATTINGGVNTTAPEVHAQREPETGSARAPSVALSDIQRPDRHPARLFHLLWQRNRQAGGVWRLFRHSKGRTPIAP